MLRPGSFQLRLYFDAIDDKTTHDVLDANVDLPLLFIRKARSQLRNQHLGIVSLDYRFRQLTDRESLSEQQ
jgi:hypothetical protein